jgi:hypothetical protein
MKNSNAYKTQRIINSILFEQANCWMAERLADLVAGLMTDPKYSDLTLECDGEKFAVHKALVLTQSVVLEKACQGPWKVFIEPLVCRKKGLTICIGRDRQCHSHRRIRRPDCPPHGRVPIHGRLRPG